MSTVTRGELISIDTSNPVALYDGGINDVLDAIEREVRSHVPDISTDKGRKAIASLAYKVAQSKTALDELGKNLVADWKAKSAAVDAERRKLRDRLDSLKEEVRRPLTEWEEAEKRRVAEHEAQIAVIITRGDDARNNWQTMDLADMKWALGSLSIFDAYDWEEFHVRGEAAIAQTSDCIKEAIDRREKYDAEQAELARLRREAAERAKRDHEERIAKEAAEKAKREAEEKAERERQRIELEAKREHERAEREKAEAIRRAELAEKARKDAEALAKRNAELAAARERQRITDELEAKRKAKEAEIAKAATQQRIIDAITEDIHFNCGDIGYDESEQIARAMLAGKIRHVTISL